MDPLVGHERPSPTTAPAPTDGRKSQVRQQAAEAARTSAGRRPLSTPLVLVVLGAVVAAVVYAWQVAGLVAAMPPLEARASADRTTIHVSVLADLVARLAGVATLGAITGILVFTPRGPDNTLTPAGRRLARMAGRAGQVWFAAAALLTFASPAYINGVPMGYTFRPETWWQFQYSTNAGLAWTLTAAVALGAVGVSYFSRSYAAFVLVWVAGVLALTFVAVTGNVTVGLNHDWATDAAIVVSLTMLPLSTAAVGVLLRGNDPVPPEPAASVVHRTRRYHRLVPLVLVAAAFHAVIAWQELAGVGVTQTPFGVPTTGFFVVFALLAASWAWRQVSGEADPARSTPRRAVASVARDVVLLVGYEVFRTAANHIPPPRFLLPQSIQVNYLGYEMEVPVTFVELVTLGRPNILWIVLTTVAVGVYLWGVARVYRRGGTWPIGRTLAWLGGWGLTLYLAVSGFWEYSTAVFSWHMFVHMTVNMLVPSLCVLGGPFTLLAAASKPRPQGMPGPAEAAEAVFAYRPLQRFLAPPLLWVNYVGSLFFIYYTPLFPWLMRYHWAHQLMLLYFMVTGYAFFNMIVGVDKQMTNLPHLVKLALVISVMPFHAIFAVGIMSSASLFGADFYRAIDVTWVGDLMADQNIAGQITWLMGEIPLFIVIAALAAQWFTQDKRESSQFDRSADSGEDDSFDAYNEMLAELSRRDHGPDADVRLAALDKEARS